MREQTKRLVAKVRGGPFAPLEVQFESLKVRDIITAIEAKRWSDEAVG
jgi:hypothetical protein